MEVLNTDLIKSYILNFVGWGKSEQGKTANVFKYEEVKN